MTDDDMTALRLIDDWAFATTSSDRRWSAGSGVLERPRQTGAFAGDELVGHTGAFTMELTVPGGSVPAAGVTWVMVAPWQRRRGVLTTMMRHQLDGLKEAGEPVAALWASEAGIYGRFGYGLSSHLVSANVPRGTRLGGLPSTDLAVSLLAGAEALPACRALYERVRLDRPGMVTRSDELWQENLFDDPDTRAGSSAVRCAVARGPEGQPSGYAFFRTKPDWETGSPNGTVEVREILAHTPRAARALLDVLLDLDLMTTTSFWNLPIDHPLLTWAEQGHRLRPTTMDQLWVRLVRLDEALAARRYSAPLEIVLDVTDKHCPWNAGRWRLSADIDGSSLVRTHESADVLLDVSLLAAAYLGEDNLGRAHQAGLLDEATPGSVSRLARALRGDKAPWCAYMF